MSNLSLWDFLEWARVYPDGYRHCVSALRVFIGQVEQATGPDTIFMPRMADIEGDPETLKSLPFDTREIAMAIFGKAKAEFEAVKAMEAEDKLRLEELKGPDGQVYGQMYKPRQIR